MSEADSDRRPRLRLRYTLRQLLGLAVLVALALPALMFASLWWAAAWLSGCLLILGTSLLGILYRSGQRRAFWTGFALFGWGYMIAVYGPFLDEHIGLRLVTTKVLAYVQPTVHVTWRDTGSFRPSPRELALTPSNESLHLLRQQSGTFPSVLLHQQSGTFPIAPLPQWDYFQQVGHSLFGLLLAYFGALLSGWFYSTRSRQ